MICAPCEMTLPSPRHDTTGTLVWSTPGGTNPPATVNRSTRSSAPLDQVVTPHAAVDGFADGDGAVEGWADGAGRG